MKHPSTAGGAAGFELGDAPRFVEDPAVARVSLRRR